MVTTRLAEHESGEQEAGDRNSAHHKEALAHRGPRYHRARSLGTVWDSRKLAARNGTDSGPLSGNILPPRSFTGSMRAIVCSGLASNSQHCAFPGHLDLCHRVCAPASHATGGVIRGELRSRTCQVAGLRKVSTTLGQRSTKIAGIAPWSTRLSPRLDSSTRVSEGKKRVSPWTTTRSPTASFCAIRQDARSRSRLRSERLGDKGIRISRQIASQGECYEEVKANGSDSSGRDPAGGFHEATGDQYQPAGPRSGCPTKPDWRNRKWRPFDYGRYSIEARNLLSCFAGDMAWVAGRLRSTPYPADGWG